MRPQHERIAEIFDENGKNGKEIAAVLGISEAMVSRMRRGTVTPSDRTISTICKEFSVNENWLQTGKGEKYIPKSRAEEVEDIASAALANATSAKREKLTRLLVGVVAPLTDGEIDLLYQMAVNHGYITEK